MTRVKRSRILAAAAALPLLWTAGALVPPAAAASSSSFSTPPSNVDHVGTDHALAPGDVISIGLILQVSGGHNQAATLYLVNGRASIAFACARDGAEQGTLAIPLWGGPFHFPADYGGTNGGWYPTNELSNNNTYQTATSIPNWCEGGPLYLAHDAEAYSGSLGSPDDTSDTFHLQFHTAIAGAAGGSGSVNCGNKNQNPSDSHGEGSMACDFNQNGDASGVTPARYTPPTPPPAPTPAPTASATASPTPPSGNVPIPVVFLPSATPPPAPSRGGSGSAPPTSAPGTPGATAPAAPAGPSASSTPIPPVVINPSGPTAPAELITAITASWIPIAGVAGLLFVVVMAVLFTSRRRHRADPPS